MIYRCVPDDSECEAFRYARTRAAQLHQRHRKRYNGDLCDLEQTAVVAVLELAAKVTDCLQLPAALLIRNVDRALMKEIKGTKKSMQFPMVKGEEDGEEEPLDPEQPQQPDAIDQQQQQTLGRLRTHLEELLSERDLDIVWRTWVLGWKPEEVSNSLRKLRGNWKKYTPERVKQIAIEATDLIREKLPQSLLQAVLDLRKRPQPMEKAA